MIDIPTVLAWFGLLCIVLPLLSVALGKAWR